MTHVQSGRVLVVPVLVVLALAACGGGTQPAARSTASASTEASWEPVADSGAAATDSASPSASASTTESTSSQPSDQPSTQDVPTDAEATAAAEAFASALQGQSFQAAWDLMCDAGRQRFADAAVLQGELDLKTKKVSDHTVGAIILDTFNGDPRKKVTVAMSYDNNTTEDLSLSMTRENDRAAVCGF